MHQHPPIANHVLPPHLRNHPIDLPRPAVVGQVHPVHHGDGGVLRSHHHHNPERPLSQAQHPQDGAVGAQLLHQERTEAAPDEGAEGLADRAGRQQNTGQSIADEEAGAGRHALDRLVQHLVLELQPEPGQRVQRTALRIHNEQAEELRRHARRTTGLQRAAVGVLRTGRERLGHQEEVPVRTGKSNTQRHVHPAPHPKTGSVQCGTLESPK